MSQPAKRIVRISCTDCGDFLDIPVPENLSEDDACLFVDQWLRGLGWVHRNFSADVCRNCKVK